MSIRLLKNFHSPNADILIESVDKVRFRVNKKDLATFSEGLPPEDFCSNSDPVGDVDVDIVELPEKAVVLDLLFFFARPQRYPDIHDLGIGILVSLADAAEKYEVYAGVMACKLVMRANISEHPLEVFRYASKYDYIDLLNECAPHVLGTPFIKMLDVSMKVIKAWHRYLESLEPIRKEWVIRSLVFLNRVCNICHPLRVDLILCVAGPIPSEREVVRGLPNLCPPCATLFIGQFQNPLENEVDGQRISKRSTLRVFPNLAHFVGYRQSYNV